MSLKSLSEAKRSKTALIELTRLMMLEEKREMKLKDAFNRAADLKGLTEDQRQGKISQYYTDMNLDGNFVTSGENMWGLKSWYQNKKVEVEEDGDVKPKKVRRRRKKVEEDDELASEFAMLGSHLDASHDEFTEEDEELELELDGEFAEEVDEEERA